MSRSSGNDEVQHAESVLRRHYYKTFVQAELSSLVDALFEGEIETGEDLEERLREDADNAVTYTHDRYLIIFASESSEDGRQEAEDMGIEGNPDLAVWAMLTFQVDVRDAMRRAGMDPGDFDRLEWIREHHSDEEWTVKWDKFLERGGEVEGLEEE